MRFPSRKRKLHALEDDLGKRLEDLQNDLDDGAVIPLGLVVRVTAERRMLLRAAREEDELAEAMAELPNLRREVAELRRLIASDDGEQELGDPPPQSGGGATH